MGINGEATTPGGVLLIAAAPAGKGRLMDAAAALPALAAVPPGVLTGSAGGSVVQLVDPIDPNIVLTHLRTAAAVRGPLLVYLAGRLTPSGPWANRVLAGVATLSWGTEARAGRCGSRRCASVCQPPAAAAAAAAAAP
jgi:hypothetical protein